MEIKADINKIIERDNESEMFGLGEVLATSLEELKKHDAKCYQSLVEEISFYANGKHLSETLAKEWVSRMKNSDGTQGGKWTKSETDVAARNLNINFQNTAYNEWEWYAVMNMVYSDYFSEELELKNYIEMAKQFIEDKDAAEGKTYLYYKYITKK